MALAYDDVEDRGQVLATIAAHEQALQVRRQILAEIAAEQFVLAKPSWSILTNRIAASPTTADVAAWMKYQQQMGVPQAQIMQDFRVKIPVELVAIDSRNIYLNDAATQAWFISRPFDTTMYKAPAGEIINNGPGATFWIP